ncbi:hypothetical protein MIB92_03745 [Aestuariirhabdus sp. Z084]|uniref:DUF6586 family protein n=1 Tax=Aestuariirhabdus haliotis TaxID=2918751 RepID=UPI00201B4098|nr:DUF6586 family protein [Aestuariirhabdus haliotis]MCL6414753.1 hypothetical protein [Aestuariirhabdus haliotis]MCL6418685.1 hypothetical protein [Aestuariirhabdus haliotis]
MIDYSHITNRSLHQVWLLLGEWAERGADAALSDAYAEAVLRGLDSAYGALCAELAGQCGYNAKLENIDKTLFELRRAGLYSPELNELQQLSIDSGSWLHSMLNARVSYCTGGLTRAIAVSGGVDVDQCRQWHRLLGELIRRMRETSEEC